MVLYIVTSLEMSMTCREDEYPTSNSFVSVHMVTKCKNKAQEVATKIREESGTNTTNSCVQVWRKVDVIQVEEDDHSFECKTHLCMRIVHDTLSHER